MEWKIERVRAGKTGAFQHAVFDFDGTISLIREGWQQIMNPYFTDVLMATPGGQEMGQEACAKLALQFITDLTGKQTIYQCIALAEEVARLGGTPEDPQVYKDEYSRRLLERIDGRRKGLERGELDPEQLRVPGAIEFLELLKAHGVTMYLASGTDEEHVLHEAQLIGVDKYFAPHIYGAQRDYKTFSKKMVIERIIRENQLKGSEMLGFGDGYVEIENIHDAGGFAVGVASDEEKRCGIDEWKRERLIQAGANIIIADYRDIGALEELLFG